MPRPARLVSSPDGLAAILGPLVLAALARSWSPVSMGPEPWIGDDAVLGMTTDELGVERVVGYRMEGRE